MIYGFALLCVVVAVLGVLVAAALAHTSTQLRRMQGQCSALKETLQTICSDVGKQMETLAGCISDLKNGMVPDYEKAKAAVKAVNDFNSGLAAIMDYDPMRAIKRERGKGDSE